MPSCRRCPRRLIVNQRPAADTGGVSVLRWRPVHPGGPHVGPTGRAGNLSDVARGHHAVKYHVRLPPKTTARLRLCHVPFGVVAREAQMRKATGSCLDADRFIPSGSQPRRPGPGRFAKSTRRPHGTRPLWRNRQPRRWCAISALTRISCGARSQWLVRGCLKRTRCNQRWGQGASTHSFAVRQGRRGARRARRPRRRPPSVHREPSRRSMPSR